MPILIEETGSNILKVQVNGKLIAEDFERWLPEVEKFIRKNERINVLVEVRDFAGWEMEAWWERMWFSIKHFDDIERIAVIAEKKRHELLDQFSNPYAMTKTRYFEPKESEEALGWLTGSPK